MKYAKLLLISLCFSKFAIASEGIYSALNIQEKAMSAKRTELKFQKSIGGLTCIRVNHISIGDSFSCSIQLESANSEQIYEALNIEPIPMAANRLTLKYRKDVANLSCVKTSVLHQDDNYICTLHY